MQLLHESTVLPEEIDSLGHMNVRYYMMRMQQANRILIDNLGIDSTTLATSFLRSVDTYTRFKQEQFEGATLHTKGGVLALGDSGMQSYIEISNPQTNQVAATFIVTTALIDRASRSIEKLPAQHQSAPSSQYIEIPDYAQPRSLSLGPVNTNITLEELQTSIPEVEGGGMMSGRRETTIEAIDADDAGWLKEDIEVMFLPFAKMALQEGIKPGPPVFTLANNQRIGWAVMETRTMLLAQPRLKDELAYFSADIKLETKSRLSRRWALDKNTGKLLGMSDTVGLCIDLDARRAIDWPVELRLEIEKNLQPQLA